MSWWVRAPTDCEIGDSRAILAQRLISRTGPVRSIGKVVIMPEPVLTKATTAKQSSSRGLSEVACDQFERLARKAVPYDVPEREKIIIDD